MSHLLFVDDSFLFFKARENEAKINLQNYKVTFSKNVDHTLKNAIIKELVVIEGDGGGKYLGFSSCVGKSKKAIFNFIKESVWKKINCWSGRILSMLGRKVIVKVVLQAIPMYYMIIFLIPHTLGDEIQRMMNSCWWGSSRRESKGLNWLSWDKLCTLKENEPGISMLSI